MDMAENKARKWRAVLTAVTLIGLVLLVVFARESISQTFSNLNNVAAWVLLFMVVWQALNYLAYTQLYRSVFKILDKSVQFKTMLRVAIELNFVNTVFPSVGVAGFSYFGFRMKEFGISASKATLVHLMRFISVFFAFQVLLLFGLIILSIGGRANNFTILVAGSISTALFFLSLTAIYIVGHKNRIDVFTRALTKVVNKVIQAVRPKHPETINLAVVRKLFLDLHEEYNVLKKKRKELKRPLLYAILASATEVATLYTVFLAFGEPVNPGAVIIAYAVANLAGIISVFPGGAGVYEALMTGVLAVAGVPPSIGLPATIMYRIISMSLQLPLGYYLYQKFLKNAGISPDKLS
jgi:glycosyltransferase 2 family protein